ncbi:hypothetical protein SAMN05216226_102158 [Halovenus aranensis]|uniref:Uncharacterized protein n=1 Tax=Halovenus aranensis TaxID=890420 RepID=A0A1G8SWA9_9EURY|nr:hypothetical protein [Halovenus aranensis]SDJ33015.1 hypothetical protein SAMN05216226_102158 [Halovenus aranensis]
MPTRRQYLQSLAAAGGATVVVESASAADLDDIDSEYSHVDTSFEQATLEQFQPRLLVDGETRPNLRNQLAWVARSDEYDTTACCYVTRYSHQEGLTGLDSHLYDTEPVYVFVDEDAGTVDEVIFTGWHWNAAAVSGSAAPLSAQRTDTETHVSLTVVSPWHNYVLARPDSGAFFGLTDWHARRSYLVDNGLYERGAVEAFEEPWTMHSDHGARGGWWNEKLFLQADGPLPIRVNIDYLTMRVWRRIGIRGWSDRAENLR